MGPKVEGVDRSIAQLAAEAHGVVTSAELLSVGLTRNQISARVARGSLIRVHRGVYRVGHAAPSVLATYMAAVKAAGDGARLGGHAGAFLWELIKGEPPAPEVLAPRHRTVTGVRIRERRSQHRADWSVRRGIPVTSVPATIVDLAGTLDAAPLARVFHEATVRYGTTPVQVEAVLERRPRSGGAARLRSVVHGEVKVVLSVIETRFLSLLRGSCLPLPDTNRPAGGRRVDCRWPAFALTVELDGYRYHRSRHAWERDRRREREARARGDDFRRYTYGDVMESPRLMLRELRALLLPRLSLA